MVSSEISKDHGWVLCGLAARTAHATAPKGPGSSHYCVHGTYAARAGDGVLGAVARALQLDDVERQGLFDLARHLDAGEPRRTVRRKPPPTVLSGGSIDH